MFNLFKSEKMTYNTIAATVMAEHASLVENQDFDPWSQVDLQYQDEFLRLEIEESRKNASINEEYEFSAIGNLIV